MASFNDGLNINVIQQFNDVLPCGESRITLNDRLYNMMKITKVIISETLPLSKFSQYSKVSFHRANAIRWIKDVSHLSKVSTETCETSIQIFDRFLGICFLENKNIFGNSTDVSLAAAVSVLLSSKVHETRPLSMSSFSHLRISDMVAFEKLVLTKLSYCLFPSATPGTFVRLLLDVWTEHYKLHPILLFTANELINEFVEAPEAPQFAPSTIALSALLLSFSKLDMDCTSWLEHVPNICLPSPNHPIYNSAIILRYLDVDLCLSVFQRLYSLESTATTTNTTTCSNISNASTIKATLSPTIILNSPNITNTSNQYHHTISPNSYCETPPPITSVPLLSTSSTSITTTSPTTTGCTVFSHSESDCSLLSNLSAGTNIIQSEMDDVKFIRNNSSNNYSIKSYNNNYLKIPNNSNSNGNINRDSKDKCDNNSCKNSKELNSKYMVDDDRPSKKKSKNIHINSLESTNTSF